MNESLVVLEKKEDTDCQHHWKILEAVAPYVFNSICLKCRKNRLFYGDSPYDENSRTIRPEIVRKYHGFHKVEKEEV